MAAQTTRRTPRRTATVPRSAVAPGRSTPIRSEEILLAREMLALAAEGCHRREFLRAVSIRLLERVPCDTVEILLEENGRRWYTETQGLGGEDFTYENRTDAETPAQDAIDRLGGFECTPMGSRWAARYEGHALPWEIRQNNNADHVGQTGSIALFRLGTEENDGGLVVLKSQRRGFFTRRRVERWERTAELLGVAAMLRRTQLALRERIKELTCLYGLARLGGQRDLNLDQILDATASLLPPAWLYPEIASARIVVDGREHTSDGYRPGVHRLRADIVMADQCLGFVEVSYSEDRPLLGEGPFLREERSLIDTVAREIALLVERKRADEERENLAEQLRHADRLATIGQLAAGVAHELNEPLAGILGFAQLAAKEDQTPQPVRDDLERIVAASLHAREVIRKLLVFARESSPGKEPVDLNQVVEEGLYFLQARCAKSGIEVTRRLDPGLPVIMADRGQLHQVLVNLVVNAMQAMPEGGLLTIRTGRDGNDVLLVVEDAGIGMSDDVLRKIFTPFFTTKDVNAGTGLGLPVVHGIVAAHTGRIRVDSAVGKGSTFEIRLPITMPGEQKAAND